MAPTDTNQRSGDDTTVTIPVATGFARLSGECTNGLQWIEYELDPFTMDEPYEDECSICGREIVAGWLCLDGGETVCSEHVHIQRRD